MAFDQKAWQRAKPGLLSRAYASIKCRCLGNQVTSPTYVGLPFMPKDTFIDWSLNDPAFSKYYDEWVTGGYERNRIPTPDRIVAELGYQPGNVRWLPYDDNSRPTQFKVGNKVRVEFLYGQKKKRKSRKKKK